LLTKLTHLLPRSVHLLANAAKGLLQRRNMMNNLLLAVSYRTGLLANLNYIAGAEVLLWCQHYRTTPVTYRDNPFLVEDS
jgi:hypothetical protein